jgi:RNA polymerase-binding protein DksA
VAKKTTTKKTKKRQAGTPSRPAASSRSKAGGKKKAVVRKATKKAGAKKAAKRVVTKKVTRKVVSKKVTKKPVAKKVTKKAPVQKAASKTVARKKTAELGTPRRRRRQTVVEAVLASETDSHGFVIINGRRIRRISAASTKKTRKRSTTVDAAAQARKAAEAKPVKTTLSRAELKSFREMLLVKRRQLLSAVDSMENEALRSDDGDTSNMPIHMADVGSDAYEQDLMLGMAASERERIKDIDEALMRIKNGTYGVCASTKKMIALTRLNAKPWAKYTIEAARKVERGL